MVKKIRYRGWSTLDDSGMSPQFDDLNDILIRFIKIAVEKDSSQTDIAECVVWMQSVDVEDKDGALIFESDIIEHKDWGVLKIVRGIGEYRAVSKNWKTDAAVRALQPKKVSIIGNIYQTPKLFK